MRTIDGQDVGFTIMEQDDEIEDKT